MIYLVVQFWIDGFADTIGRFDTVEQAASDAQYRLAQFDIDRAYVVSR